MRWTLLTLALLAVPTLARGEIKTEEVRYRHGDVECIGFLAYDDAVTGKRPGVLVVHEWWGLNEYARERARQIAGLGYVAFAADMYGEGKTAAHPMDAGAMAGKVRMNIADWRSRGMDALNVLKSRPEVDPEKLAAIGYCFGGSTAIQLALSGADIDIAASFHGGLPVPTAAEAKAVKGKILVYHGNADAFIPQTAVDAFRKPLNEGQTKYAFHGYPNVRHSFTVPDADSHKIENMKYDKQADEESWNSLKSELAAAWK